MTVFIINLIINKIKMIITKIRNQNNIASIYSLKKIESKVIMPPAIILPKNIGIKDFKNPKPKNTAIAEPEGLDEIESTTF